MLMTLRTVRYLARATCVRHGRVLAVHPRLVRRGKRRTFAQCWDKSAVADCLPMLCWQAYIHNGSAAEWLLPIGSSDPTYASAAVKALNSGPGTCLSPNTQPACTAVSGTSYCYNSGSNNLQGQGPDFCHRFLAPQARSPTAQACLSRVHLCATMSCAGTLPFRVCMPSAQTRPLIACRPDCSRSVKESSRPSSCAHLQAFAIGTQGLQCATLFCGCMVIWLGTRGTRPARSPGRTAAGPHAPVLTRPRSQTLRHGLQVDEDEGPCLNTGVNSGTYGWPLGTGPNIEPYNDLATVLPANKGPYGTCLSPPAASGPCTNLEYANNYNSAPANRQYENSLRQTTSNTYLTVR